MTPFEALLDEILCDEMAGRFWDQARLREALPFSVSVEAFCKRGFEFAESDRLLPEERCLLKDALTRCQKETLS